MRKYNSLRSKAGFTLIELLVSISIVAALSSVAIASTQQAREKAIMTAFVLNIDQMRKAIGVYRSTYDTVPHCTNTFPCNFLPALMTPLVTSNTISRVLSTGPGLLSYVTYWTGYYLPNGTIDERRCGSDLTDETWIPGTEPGVMVFIHESGREYGYPHQFTQCTTWNGPKECSTSEVMDWLTCVQLY